MIAIYRMTLPLIFILHAGLGFIIWFSPREICLRSANISRPAKFFWTLFWPAYLIRQRTSFFSKTLTAGYLAFTVTVIGGELLEYKVVSLRADDVKSVETYSDYSLLPADEAAQMELAKNRSAYLDAINQKTVDQMIRLADNPDKARAALILYIIRNGVIANDDTPSLKQIHESRLPIDCYGAAIIAAGLLADDGFPPMLLSLRTSPDTFLFNPIASSIHMVYIYRTNGCFGYISLQKSVHPIFHSLEELIDDVSAGFQVVFTEYFLFNLNQLIPDYLVENSGISDQEIWFRTSRANWWDWFLAS